MHVRQRPNACIRRYVDRVVRMMLRVLLEKVRTLGKILIMQRGWRCAGKLSHTRRHQSHGVALVACCEDLPGCFCFGQSLPRTLTCFTVARRRPTSHLASDEWRTLPRGVAIFPNQPHRHVSLFLARRMRGTSIVLSLSRSSVLLDATRAVWSVSDWLETICAPEDASLLGQSGRCQSHG